MTKSPIRWFMRVAAAIFAGALIVGTAKLVAASRFLNSPNRIDAWREIQREDIRDMLAVVGDPHAVRLWLTAGRDPNGRDCAGLGERPNAFGLGILKPMGLCEPDNAAGVPLLRAIRSQSVASVRLIIDAGADVNEVSRDGIVPLQMAVLLGDEGAVRVLLDAGANPVLRPKFSEIGDYSSALESAQRARGGAAGERILEALRAKAATDSAVR